MHSKLGPAIVGLLTLASIYFVAQIQIDNRHDRLLDNSTQEARDFERFQEQFGNDEFIIIGISGKPLFEEEGLDVMIDVLFSLEEHELIEEVRGLPAFYLDLFEAEDPEAFEEDMTSTPFYEGLFLSPDHQVAGLLVEPIVLDAPKAFRGLAEGIQEAVQPLKDYGYQVDVVGGAVFDDAINKLSIGESLRMFPIAAIASLIILIGLLRSFKATSVVLICGVVSLLITLGLVVASGRSLNIVTSALPLILWVLAIANCIHIVSRYQRALSRLGNREEAIRDTMATLWFSCALSSVTTAFGFASLMVADIGPIRELGAYMALGMLVSLGVNLVFCPFLLGLFKVSAPKEAHERSSRALLRLSGPVIANPRPIVLLFALLVVAGIYGAFQIRTEANSVRFLPEGSQLRESYIFVAENLTGLHTLELAIDTPGGWANPEYWPKIEELTDTIAESELVAKIYTPLDFLKKVNQWEHDFDVAYYVLPETGEEAEELLDLMFDEDSDQLTRFTTEDREHIRISVLVNTLDAYLFSDVVKHARELVADLDAPLSGKVTGTAARMQAMQLGLISTQLKSFSLAFVLVFISIFVGLRSMRLTLLAIIPNLMPLLSVFATMALLGAALDAGTVMVASISLGIAVDDTVHFLVGYRRHRELGESNYTAVRSTLSKVGPSLIVTTITACIGFFTISQSAFPPISYLGLFSGIAILVALLADLLLLPAIFALGRDDQ